MNMLWMDNNGNVDATMAMSAGVVIRYVVGWQVGYMTYSSVVGQMVGYTIDEFRYVGYIVGFNPPNQVRQKPKTTRM